MKNKKLFSDKLFALSSAVHATKKRTDIEFKLFKELYFKLIVDKSLSQKELFAQMQVLFKNQNLKLGRTKFFVLKTKIEQEELEKDWWVTKRKKEIEERNEMLRKKGAKEIRFIVIDSNGENLEDFVDKKNKAIEDGMKKGSRKGAQSTRDKFI